MDSSAQEAVSSNNMLRLIDCMSMPDSVYPLIWSFLLDSDSETGSSLDFKSIMLFMLVNKTSKDTFDDCRGWWLCTQALKQEAEAKELLTNHVVFRSTAILYSMRLLWMNLWKIPCYCDEVGRAREMDSHILLIQGTLLPEVSWLAILYGGKRVSMCDYDSIADVLSHLESFVLFPLNQW